MHERHPKLRKLADLVPEFLKGVDIGLLIGCNCPKALGPLRVMSSTDGALACLLRLGWVVNGPMHPGDNHNASCYRVMIDNSYVQELLVPEVANLKNEKADFEIGSERIPGERGWSQEDRLFMEKMKTGTVISSGHYEIPLPLKVNDASLPCNRAQAVQRALCLSRKLSTDKDYCNEYSAFMNELFERGYAERVPFEKLRRTDGRVWYLPHHGVRHPQKKSIRVVFDCSAVSGGTSLNAQLLSGPNLNNTLVGVLTRFREGEVCFLADVEKMFYQVRVPECDRDYLRFLWWPEGDTSKPLQEFRMTVHIFGATSSPSVCVYALQRIPDDYACSREATSTIRNHFYVDDCLRSVRDASDASQLISELRDVCGQGGFHLHKFVSNKVEVLKTIPMNEMAKDIQNLDFDVEPLPSGRTLGLQWHVGSDEFGFSFTPKSKPPTRRGLLSVISSVYDPLGLVSPIVLPAKLLLQELCRAKLGWDEELPPSIQQKWEEWVRSMSSIVTLRVSRCIAPSCDGSVSLCVFSDASSEAYGAVAYLRVCAGAHVECFLLMGKSRVKPLKSITIPRMELTAATVALKMGTCLSQELSCQPSVIYFTDSTSVLYFLRNTERRFPVFVANRVQLILDFSSCLQWRFVPSSENPADLASRGITMKSEDCLRLWFRGPPFLLKHESEWPKDPCVYDTNSVDSFAAEVEESENEPLDALLSYYSNFTRMKRAVCVFLRLLEILKSRVHNGRDHRFQSDDVIFSVSSLREAEKVIVRRVQMKKFPKEVEHLKKFGHVSIHSSVHRLDPFLHDGILRVGGRLSSSALNHDLIHPWLLPKDSPVTTLIVRHYHELLGHSGSNHVLSKLRERFWIVHGNATVRKVIFRCVTCRKRRGFALTQKMADLPVERLSAEPPFTYTGIDLFGPFLVKNARKEVKRYGVLFTCMSCRAIHLEIVNTLETDSLINAIRRFVARRGQTKSIFCDNGTNLVGAEKELSKALKECNERARNFLMQHQIEWHFNTPCASHKGGAWERMIRSVRAVLTNLLKEFGLHIDDEALHTVMCEAEAIVNSRPLTVVSDNPNDLIPLSPSQLLTMKSSSAVPPPGDFDDSPSLYARKRWRRVQYLMGLFWSRWQKEYVHLLQPRARWNSPQRNLKEGDVVLVVDEQIPRGLWRLGRICAVKESPDDLVRSVSIKSKTSILQRPVNKCVLVLPVEEQSS